MRKIPPFRVTRRGITARLHQPVAWRPMTDEEWDDIQFIFAWLHPDRGRPLASPRLALDACFHAACSGKPWRELPAVFGKWQTIHRLFVRWTHKGAWEQLLKYVASKHHRVAASLTWWVCMAFRRARRVLGLRGIMLARRLGMDSALHAPSWFLPDPLLHRYAAETWLPQLVETFERERLSPALSRLIEILKGFWAIAGGRARISRWMAPELFFTFTGPLPNAREAL
ncbi:MAG: transposase [Alphaproteobacteria bacterium]|nr:transposase [Alphaproteobacteria bacterium]